MKFIQIGNKLINSDVIGEIKQNNEELTIIYRLEGGREEKEVFSSDAEYQDKITELGNL